MNRAVVHEHPALEREHGDGHETAGERLARAISREMGWRDWLAYN